MSGRKHLDWALPIVGICLALAIAFGLGWLQREETGKNQQAAEHQEAEGGGRASGVRRGADGRVGDEKIPHDADSGEHEQTTRKEQGRSDREEIEYQWMSAWGTVSSAAIAFLALGITFWGLLYIRSTLRATLQAVRESAAATEEMRKTNDIAEDVSQRQLRAYLYPRKTEIAGRAGPDLMDLDFSVIIANTGATPAKMHFCVIELSAGWSLPLPNGKKSVGSTSLKVSRDFRERLVGPHSETTIAVDAKADIGFFGTGRRYPVRYMAVVRYRYTDYLDRTWEVSAFFDSVPLYWPYDGQPISSEMWQTSASEHLASLLSDPTPDLSVH